uniref:Uncharacterized protein n=1 Tax=Amphimedon queenslandica TaxID=400682 RepID=A0A1X7UFZ8_AMPQE
MPSNSGSTLVVNEALFKCSYSWLFTMLLTTRSTKGSTICSS